MLTRLKRRGTALALGAVLALGAAACQPPADDPVEEPAEETEDPTDTVEEPADEPVAAPDPFGDLKRAADHVGPDGTARVLADGMAAGAELDGDIDAPAARTWARLSTLLAEHVYLTGIAVDAAYAAGFDSGEFELAADTLDRNSQELADIVRDVAGEEDADAFLDRWRELVGSFVDYAVATGERDEDGQQRAVSDLDGHRAQVGALFEDLTGGELAAEVVEGSLEGHVDAFVAAADALADGDPDASDHLREAAAHVSTDGSARVLAEGLVSALELEGDLGAAAVESYVELSTLLSEHVYLVGVTVRTGFAEGLDSAAFAAAANTLDTNSVEIADLVGSGADERGAFLDLWREHIEIFVDYARAAAGDDDQLRERAVADLDDHRAQAGAFFEDLTGGELAADAVSGSLDGHVETLSQAIDSLAAAMR